MPWPLRSSLHHSHLPLFTFPAFCPLGLHIQSVIPAHSIPGPTGLSPFPLPLSCLLLLLLWLCRRLSWPLGPLRLLFLLRAPPGCHGDPKWSALLSLQWGSKVICCSLFTGPLLSTVFDFVHWLAIPLDPCPPHKSSGHTTWAAAQLWCLLMIGVPHFLIHDPTPVAPSACWPFLVFSHPRPPLWWSCVECLAAPRVRYLTALLSGLWGGLDFPLGLAALRFTVNLARFTKTRGCTSCFGSTISGTRLFTKTWIGSCLGSTSWHLAF